MGPVVRFSDGTLRRFWKKGRAKGIDARSAEHLMDLLSSLDAATEPKDMDQPGWGFHPLTGDRKGQYAVEIRGLFRLVFEWEGDEAVRVRVEDYHGR
jgi:proteic killer suppression protein